MSRILVLGGGGMLGHKLVQTLGETHEVFCTLRRFDEALRATGIFREERVLVGVDAWDSGSVRRALADVRPAWVINCIGIIKQREEARDPTQAIHVNALFPHLLARETGEAGARLIHVSTDCVFSGRRGPYRETDPSDAEDLYGRSKYLGEVTGPGCLTLRTSIIGRDLFVNLSLVDWFLSRAGTEIRGYARTLYTGLTTRAMSREIGRIVADHSGLERLYQVSSAPISKYDLLCMLDAAFGTKTTIVRDEAEVSDRSLLSERYWRETASRAPTWTEMVAELAADPTDYAGFRRVRR